MASAWINFVKAYHAKHGGSFSDALKKSAVLWKKKKAGGGGSDADAEKKKPKKKRRRKKKDLLRLVKPSVFDRRV